MARTLCVAGVRAATRQALGDAPWAVRHDANSVARKNADGAAGWAALNRVFHPFAIVELRDGHLFALRSGLECRERPATALVRIAHGVAAEIAPQVIGKVARGEMNPPLAAADYQLRVGRPAHLQIVPHSAPTAPQEEGDQEPDKGFKGGHAALSWRAISASSASSVLAFGSRSPRSKRETVAWLTPSSAANADCDRPRLLRVCAMSMNPHICAFA